MSAVATNFEHRFGSVGLHQIGIERKFLIVVDKRLVHGIIEVRQFRVKFSHDEANVAKACYIAIK